MNNDARKILKTLDDATEQYHGVRPYGTKKDEDDTRMEAQFMWIEGQGIVKVWEIQTKQP